MRRPHVKVPSLSALVRFLRLRWLVRDLLPRTEEEELDESCGTWLFQAKDVGALLTVGAEESVEKGKERCEVLGGAKAGMVAVVETRSGKPLFPRPAWQTNAAVHEDGVQLEKERDAEMRRERDAKKNEGQVLCASEERDFDGVLAKRSEPVEIFGGVVNFVKTPQQGTGVSSTVIGVAPELKHSEAKRDAERPTRPSGGAPWKPRKKRRDGLPEEAERRGDDDDDQEVIEKSTDGGEEQVRANAALLPARRAKIAVLGVLHRYKYEGGEAYIRKGPGPVDVGEVHGLIPFEKSKGRREREPAEGNKAHYAETRTDDIEAHLWF